jgi:excisionase family DNA binding protein
MNRISENNSYLNGLGEQFVGIVQEMSRVMSETQFEELKQFIQEEVRKTVKEYLGDINPEYYTREEAANKLAISLVSLDKYIKAGIIKAVRFGRNVRILSNDLKAAMKELKSNNRKK